MENNHEDMEKNHQSNAKKQLGNSSKLVHLWSAQCGECFKWRLIPSEEEFEEIRSKFIDEPFVCSKIPHISCRDHAEIEYDDSRTWMIHKPNIPKTPAGFKRQVVIRKSLSRTDCYYNTPNGKRLRSSIEVDKFLDKYPDYRKKVSIKDFSFAGPKVMEDTLPHNVAKNEDEVDFSHLDCQCESRYCTQEASLR